MSVENQVWPKWQEMTFEQREEQRQKVANDVQQLISSNIESGVYPDVIAQIFHAEISKVNEELRRK